MWCLVCLMYLSQQVLVCGYDLTRCVNFTMCDLINNWHGDLRKLVLLENGKLLCMVCTAHFTTTLCCCCLYFSACCSPLEQDDIAEAFMKYISQEGVRISTTESVFNQQKIKTLQKVYLGGR